MDAARDDFAIPLTRSPWGAVQARDAVNGEIRALIGDAAFAQLERSAPRSLDTKPMIEYTFGVDLKTAGIPLTAEQLTSIARGWDDVKMTRARTARDGSSTGETVDPQTELSPQAQALIDRFARELTPAQLQVVKDHFVESAKWGELVRKHGQHISDSLRP